MLVPLSWLKDYVDVTLPTQTLGEKLTEIGLGTEKITKEGTETILELEITPNRPDLLSMIGVAREVAALEGKNIDYPKLKTTLRSTGKVLPLEIKTDSAINPRFTAIIIEGVTVKESPEWLKKRLEQLGQRPINNIVDITNFVMLELGNPLHAFDYDKIEGHTMEVALARGGEEFKSVDGIVYRLPQDAVIIRDQKKIIDLCGIKGGWDCGTFAETKTIVLRVPVEVPNLIRRASQSLGLRSEASSIFERGVNRGGTIDALKRATDLILEYAGGKIASNLYDLKKDTFAPWKLSLRLERLQSILGITIPEKEVIAILESLNLNPVILATNKVRSPESMRDSGVASLSRMTNHVIECSIPTYRNDLQIEEDLIEEVARLYGYNKFPKTLPIGQVATQTIPYYKDYRLDEKVKHLLTAGGFFEVYTYSLISEKDLHSVGVNPQHCLRVDNPVSREFEYLRPTLKNNLIKAISDNRVQGRNISLFELGKVYIGKSVENVDEHLVLSGITQTKTFHEVKGILERLAKDLGITHNFTKDIEILEEGVFFEINYTNLIKKATKEIKFKPINKYPPIIEDIALVVPAGLPTDEVINTISSVSPLVVQVTLLDQYQDVLTFHIVYQHAEKNLTNDEVRSIREKILTHLEKNLQVNLKK